MSKKPKQQDIPVQPPRWVAIGLLLTLTLAVFGQAGSFEFLSWDDDRDVYKNPHISSGLTWNSFLWDWRALESGHWIPLTRLSHQLEYTAFGPSPGAFHTTNIVLHLATTLVVFLALERMTKARLPSALATAWFAIHPMRSESVAWVVERKDCLSGFFAALTLYAYVHYADRVENRKRFVVLLGLFVLALLSKASVAPLPIGFLLLDVWPLRRVERGWRTLIVEKLPLVAAAFGSGVVTLYARHIGVKDSGLHAGLSAYDKAANFFISTVLYLRDTVWPVGLSALYPFEAGLPVWQTAASAALVGGITWWTLSRKSTEPWLAVGWLWYLILVFPFSGLVMDGIQSRADRYTYLPHVILFLTIIWSFHVRVGGGIRVPCAALAALLAAAAYVNTGYWKDSVTLFERSIEMTGNNSLLVTSLAFEKMKRLQWDESQRLFELAARSRPLDPRVHIDLADFLLKRGKPTEALWEADEAIRNRGEESDARQVRGAVLAELGRREEALEDLRIAAERGPTDGWKGENWTIRGEYLLMWERPVEAEADFRKALRLVEPPHVSQRDLGIALLRQGRRAEAIRELQDRLNQEPGDEVARKALADAVELPN